MKALTETCVIVGPARLSYLNVFTPRKNELRNEEEYSVVLLFPKAPHKNLPDPKTEIKGIADTIVAALKEKFKEVPKVWDSCLKDGDKELNNEGEPKHPGYFYISTRSQAEYPPVLVNADRTPATGGWVSGDWGKVKINFYAYEFSGRKGVSASLRAVQFLYHDEPFGTSSDPLAVANEFDAEEGDGPAAATTNGAEEYDPFKDE